MVATSTSSKPNVPSKQVCDNEGWGPDVVASVIGPSWVAQRDMTVMIKVTGLCLNNLDPTYMYVHQNSLLLQSYSKPKTNHVYSQKIGHLHRSAGSVTLTTLHEQKPLIVCSCPTVDVGCQAETGQESLYSQRRARSLSSLTLSRISCWRIVSSYSMLFSGFSRAFWCFTFSDPPLWLDLLARLQKEIHVCT